MNKDKKNSPIKLSAPQQEIIDLIAHITVMRDVQKNIDGLDGILSFYINDRLTSRQRAIYQALQDRIVTVKKDMLRMAKEDEAKT